MWSVTGAIEFLRANLFHVGPIVVAGAFAAVITAERARALFYVYPLFGAPKFFERVRELVMTDRISEAIALCERYRGKPAASVVKEALLRAHQPEALIEQGLQIAVTEATQRVQRRTPFLATIANVATLLGLFGTIVGLIHSFEAVGTATAQQKATLLAAGISTAMNATMLGLGVAIPCMVIFSVFANRTNRLSTEIEQAASRSVDYIRQRYYSVQQQPGQESAPPAPPVKRVA